jgi:site-specific recombinase XerD
VRYEGGLFSLTDDLSISQAIKAYLDHLRATHASANTHATYEDALGLFMQTLRARQIDPDITPVGSLPEQAIAWVLEQPQRGRRVDAHGKPVVSKNPADEPYSPTSQRLIMSVLRQFYKFLVAHEHGGFNLARVQELSKAGRAHRALPQFDAQEVERVVQHALDLDQAPVESERERLANLRDRALIVTLADSGLRIHEACSLRRGQIDWLEHRAVIQGKGDRQAVIRFSPRAFQALKDYLAARAGSDHHTAQLEKKRIEELPLFARHDKGAGKLTRRLSTTGARQAIEGRVAQALGGQAVSHITPHTFRHYFVTMVLRGSGNLRLAQILARHQEISTTQLYAHLNDSEIDEQYWELFGDL